MSPKEERSIFANLFIPKSVQKTDSSFASLPAKDVQRLIDLAVESIEGKTIKKSDYENLKYGSSLSSAEFDSLFSRLLRMLKIAIRFRSKLTPDTLKQQLVDSLQVSTYFCDMFVSAVFPSKTSISNIVAVNAPHLSICDSLKWRIDVIISNNCLSKIMEPVVVFEINVSPNRKICFECKLAKFNQLRFAVASMLKVINNLEEKSVLKAF